MEQNYAGAYAAYSEELKHLTYYGLIDNMAVLTACCGSPDSNDSFLQQAVKLYPPRTYTLGFYLALLDYQHNHVDKAKVAITQAYKYGQAYQGIAMVYREL